MDLLLPVFLILLLAFANGTNDVSKAIATLVGSGVTNYRHAIAWGTAWTAVGAGLSAVLAREMVRTFGTGLWQADARTLPELALAVLLGAIGWVLLASRAGLPVSTTHAITGAIVGAGLVAFGPSGLLWSRLTGKIVLPLLFSPVLAFAVSVVLHPLIRQLAARWEGTCLCMMTTYRALVTLDARGTTRTLFQATRLGEPVAAVPAHCDRAGLSGWTVGPDTIHWLSSGLTAFARGANDAPKIVAILLLGGLVDYRIEAPAAHMALFAGVAAAMAAGSFLGGRRVTRVLAERVTRMDHTEGLSANLTTSSLVLSAAVLGLPVSTTHVSSSAIVGIGMLKGLDAVRWATVRDMVLAWLVTLPAAAVVAAGSYLALSR